MKKFLLILTAICCFAVTAAFAADGADLYAKRCAKCHQDGSATKAGGDVVLKGQPAAEIEMKLKGYVDGTYGGSKKKIMERMMGGLSADEIKAVAGHIGSL